MVFQAHNRGLTLIESVIGVALFALVFVSLYAAFQNTLKLAKAAQVRSVAVSLGNEQLEIVRNLPYARVGTVSGIPSGVIVPVQSFVRSGITFVATTTIRNIDQPFDGTAGGAPDDLSPADNKLVEVEIDCPSCPEFRPVVLTSTVAPKSLESASTNGSLFVQVIDAAGQPVSGASVRVRNPSLVPPIDINDVTATSGILQIIDAPPAVNSYEITVSKSGYSSEQTRGAPTTTNPFYPHATVAVQTVTQVTLPIDLTADVTVSSVTPLCTALSGVNVQMTGAKIISSGPNVPKFDRLFSTGGTGVYALGATEWDLYTINASSATHALAGIMPLSPVSITPGSTQNIQLVLEPKTVPGVVVTVKDGATGLPISGADVTMDLAGASTTMTTGRGFLWQTDWSGGGGQADFTDPTRYSTDDTNIDSLSVAGSVQLQPVLGIYPASGELESSTFDTGSPSNFYQFTYLPTGQAPETGDSVRFQIATGNSTSSWTYLGPDGTAGTYYNATTTDINPIHNGDRYLRYKLYLSTASSTITPSVTDAQFTFTSACIPPGQVLFQGLSDGSYTLTVTKAGYTTHVDTVVVNAAAVSWQEVAASLSP